jgi:TolB protein
MLGAEAIIIGTVRISSGSAVLEINLYDAVQQKQMVGRRYEGMVEDYREIAHRFANEVFKTMTGARGVFDTKLVYVKSDLPNKEICISDYDGAGARQVTNYRSLTLGPAWSHDGRQLAFTSYKDGNPNLYVLEIDIYRGTAKGTAKLVSRKKGINITPSWSPDDAKIALTLNLNNGNSEIYIHTLATAALERVTNDWATDVSPSWSPDGRMLTFVSDRTGGPQIYTVDLSTGRFKRISFNESSYNTSPAWSPRGDRIAYVGQVGGRYNIFISSTDGQYQQQITSGQGNNEDPAWSPDGRFLAFSSSRTGQKEIYIMRPDGNGAKRITFGKGAKTEPAWSSSLSNK